MCMACEEMQLYYAYLDAVEAEEAQGAAVAMRGHGDRAGR